MHTLEGERERARIERSVPAGQCRRTRNKSGCFFFLHMGHPELLEALEVFGDEEGAEQEAGDDLLTVSPHLVSVLSSA